MANRKIAYTLGRGWAYFFHVRFQIFSCPKMAIRIAIREFPRDSRIPSAMMMYQLESLGDRIGDLGKGAFGMWAFIAHGGLSKPTVGFQNLFRASKIMGPIFLKKKSACGNVGGRSGLPEIWGSFF